MMVIPIPFISAAELSGIALQKKTTSYISYNIWARAEHRIKWPNPISGDASVLMKT
jgi:hypothetical protein